MRKFFLLVLLMAALGWLAEPCQSQSLEARIRNIYAPLDKSEVQSSILIHQTPVFLWPGRYDGINVADSMQLSLDKFGFLFGQFRGAAVGLPPPSSDINGMLHQQFFQGYKQFTIDAEGSGEFVPSDTLFKPLADINDGDLNSMTGGCQSFVLAAQAFVPGNPIPFGGDGSERSVTTSASQPFMFASPNPTAGHLSLAFPDNPCILRVFDSYGRIVHQMQAFGGTASLDGSAWPNGVYTVESISAEFREQIKVVIQR
ncbi:MAG: T9SS type A sorting domain-containing protein [Saprospiraceae bacterium]|nr:T9SS type A sorting domain-containing protein [Saprospiraceae bacterium]